MTARAYIYTRMSTAEQLKGDSKRRQLSRAFEYAREHSLQPEVISDHGVSAFRGNNLVFGRLAHFHQQLSVGDIPVGSYLIVESLDRLSRDEVTHAISLFVNIVNAGITLVTLFDGQEYSSESLAKNPMSIFVAMISFATASEESKKKSARLSAAWNQKKQLSRTTGKPLSGMVPAWLKLDRSTNKIIPIPERAAVVSEIFQLSIAGWGSMSITRLLNDRQEPVWGSPSKNTTGTWHESYIQKILSNRAVLGEYAPRKNVYVSKNKAASQPDGEAIQNYYPVVIDAVTFEMAAEARRLRKVSGAGRKGEGFANLFTGLLRCGCGAGIRYINKGYGPKGGQYLQCSVSKIAGRCTLPRLRYQLFEDAILRKIEGINVAAALGLESAQTKQSNLERRKLSLELEQRKIENQQSKLLEILLSDSTQQPEFLKSTFAQFDAQKVIVNNEIDGIKVELQQIKLADPHAYKSMLDQLLVELRSESSVGVEALRRTLAAEIKKLVQSIRLQYQPLEVYDGPSPSASNRLPDEADHSVTIQYHSHLTQIISISSGSGLKLRWDPRFALLKSRSAKP